LLDGLIVNSAILEFCSLRRAFLAVDVEGIVTDPLDLILIGAVESLHFQVFSFPLTSSPLNTKVYDLSEVVAFP
jgi:hypothetical protein